MDVWVCWFCFCYCKQCCYEHCVSRRDTAWPCGMEVFILQDNGTLLWLYQSIPYQHYVSYLSFTFSLTLDSRLFHFANLMEVKWHLIVVSSKSTIILIFVLLYVMCPFSLPVLTFLSFKQFDYDVLGVDFFHVSSAGAISCGFMVFIKFGTFLAVTSSIIIIIIIVFPVLSLLSL